MSVQRKRRFLFGAAIGVLVFANHILVRDSQAQNITTVKQVVERWREREHRYRSVRFEWKGQFTETAETMLGPAEGVPASGAITKELHYSLVMDGLNVRHSSLGEKFSPITGAPVYLDTPYTAVFDGAKSHLHFDRGSSPGPNSEISLGYIRDGYQERDNYHIAPIVYHFRALQSELTGLDEDTFVIVAKQAVIDGAACIVVRRPSSPPAAPGSAQKVRRPPHEGAQEMLFYVDPAKDCAIRRYEYMTPSGDSVFTGVDIEYQQDPSGEWVPMGWKAITRPPDGRFGNGLTARVEAYRLNPEIDASEFTYTFPPDTLVRDDTDHTRYVARDGGERRLVTHEEEASGGRNFPEYYNRLLKTESGQAASGGTSGAESRRTQFWIWSASGVAIVLLALLLRWRRLRALRG